MVESLLSQKKECIECLKSLHICKFRRFARVFSRCNACELKTNEDYRQNICKRGRKKRIFKSVEFIIDIR